LYSAVLLRECETEEINKFLKKLAVVFIVAKVGETLAAAVMAVANKLALL
jgi:hypothetical protein